MDCQPIFRYVGGYFITLELHLIQYEIKQYKPELDFNNGYSPSLKLQMFANQHLQPMQP